MSNILRKWESEEVVIYTEQVYGIDILNKCRGIHSGLVADGKLEGAFDDDKWIGYSDIKRVGIDFSIDVVLYDKHVGKEFGISIESMKNMLRSYAIYCNGAYIYQTIARKKIGTIKAFLQKYKDKDFKLTEDDIFTIKDFLGFINTSDERIREIISNIRCVKSGTRSQRKLSPLINYLVVENEINRIYREGCDDTTFKKWFPIYFWTNITFILPLRATEMLLTPKDCIYRENGKWFLKVRRTKLKKGRRTVYYDINKDYRIFTYKIPNTEAILNIEKYMELTKNQERRFLFEYNKWMINEMVSLSAFNNLLRNFIEENIIGNCRYDFAKFATGIEEYEVVTAGDSRPIAMANLYFQKAGEDICRQLADHIYIDTSAGYYTNISETIWASSVIQHQRKLEYEREYSKEQYEKSMLTVVELDKSICTSLKHMRDAENLEDCVEQGHLEDCMGCKFYKPTKSELDFYMELQKKKADDSAKRVIEFMNNTMSIKNRDLTLEEVFLSVHTEVTRYRMGCDVKAEERLKEWQELKNIQKISC